MENLRPDEVSAIQIEDESTETKATPETKEDIFAQYEALRYEAIVVRNATVLRNAISELYEVRTVRTISQPELARRLDAIVMQFDSRLALQINSEANSEFDLAMGTIIQQLKVDKRLTDEEKEMVLAQINEANASGSNYRM